MTSSNGFSLLTKSLRLSRELRTKRSDDTSVCKYMEKELATAIKVRSETVLEDSDEQCVQDGDIKKAV